MSSKFYLDHLSPECVSHVAVLILLIVESAFFCYRLEEEPLALRWPRSENLQGLIAGVHSGRNHNGWGGWSDSRRQRATRIVAVV